MIGSQDAIIRHMLGPGDTLVISGGAAAGLQPGQRFFVRRLIRTFGAQGPDAKHPVSVHTAGWIQVLAVDTSVATASVLHACEGIMLDDYLEPFTPPMIAATVAPGSLPSIRTWGTSRSAIENMGSVGAGKMIGDRPRQQLRRDARPAIPGVPGQADHAQRGGGLFADVYAEPAESSAWWKSRKCWWWRSSRTSPTVQVTLARDSVMTGDFIAAIR